MAKCLVTGCAGFIGSHVADLLIEAGHEVVGIDDLSTGKKENVNPKVDFWELDISMGSTKHMIPDDTEYIFHLAALARIQPSIEDPISSHNVNVNGTLNLLEVARKSKAKVIFSSSSSIYKGDKLPTGEGANKHPKSPYALQKLQCEEYIKLYHQLYGMKYAILRYFNVFGERQILDGAYAAVVGIFLDQKSHGDPLTITNDGSQRRDFTYVKDVALANLMAMNWSGVFNIGGGQNTSINELANLIGGDKEYIGDRVGEAKETLADNRKALSKGWKPSITIRDWINAQL